MKSILFVDDELRVLEGLRDLLRKHRRRWQVELAHGGESALRLLSEHSYDVVVTDLRMPDVDGFSVLEHLRNHHPKTVRLVLSGDSQRETAMRLVPQAHRVLSKPCQTEELQHALESACALGNLLADDSLRAIVGRIGHLPPMPRTYQRLVTTLENPNANLKDVADVVASDVALSAKALQLANSSLFGMCRPISGLTEAIGFLGLELLRTLALSEGVFGRRETPPEARAVLSRLHEHSIAVAHAAAALTNDAALKRDAFAAGMLHDIGHLVLAVERITPEPMTLVPTEPVAPPAHALVGAYLLGLWALPASIIDAVAAHHSPRCDGSSSIAELVARAEQDIESGAVLPPSENRR